MSRFRVHRTRGMQLAEFPVAMFIFFLMFFPLLNLLCLGCGACTVWFIAQQTAAKAAEQMSFADSLTQSSSLANAIAQTGVAKWVRLQPVGGYSSSGVNLFVEKLSFRTSSGQYWLYGPNATAPLPAEPADYIYTIKSEANFNVGPFLSMAGIPFVGDIPGLGQPAAITIMAGKAVEEPDHIVSNTNTLLASTGSGGIIAAQPGGWPSPGSPPEIYQTGGNPIVTATYWVPDFPGASTGYMFKVDMAMTTNGGGQSNITGRYVTNYAPSSTGYILTGNQFSFAGANGSTQTMGVNPGQNIDMNYFGDYCIGASGSTVYLLRDIQTGSNGGTLQGNAQTAAATAVQSALTWLQGNMPAGMY